MLQRLLLVLYLKVVAGHWYTFASSWSFLKTSDKFSKNFCFKKITGMSSSHWQITIVELFWNYKNKNYLTWLTLYSINLFLI